MNAMKTHSICVQVYTRWQLRESSRRLYHSLRCLYRFGVVRGGVGLRTGSGHAVRPSHRIST
jgi:hypothetical protein